MRIQDLTALHAGRTIEFHTLGDAPAAIAAAPHRRRVFATAPCLLRLDEFELIAGPVFACFVPAGKPLQARAIGGHGHACLVESQAAAQDGAGNTLDLYTAVPAGLLVGTIMALQLAYAPGVAPPEHPWPPLARIDAEWARLPEFSIDPARAPLLRAALRGLAAMPHERVDPARLALALGVSFAELRHVFRQQLGMDVLAYRKQQRMRWAACRLLERGEAIPALAAVAGYKSGGHFKNDFVEVFGVPPSRMIPMFTAQLLSRSGF